MMTLLPSLRRSVLPAARPALLLTTLLLAALLAGCGSTKVYTADKTIVYRDSLYNLSNVQKISPSIEATLPNGDRVNMKTLDKNGQEKMFKDNDEVRVSMVVDMDAQQLVYLNTSMKNYSDYKKASGRFDDAMEDINKFMADKKKTQLKLK